MKAESQGYNDVMPSGCSFTLVVILLSIFSTAIFVGHYIIEKDNAQREMNKRKLIQKHREDDEVKIIGIYYEHTGKNGVVRIAMAVCESMQTKERSGILIRDKFPVVGEIWKTSCDGENIRLDHVKEKENEK